MECEERIIDQRIHEEAEEAEQKRLAERVFALNHTFSGSPEYAGILNEIFGDRIGEGSTVLSPEKKGAYYNRITIGRNVIINAGFTAMAFGGVTIEDDVVIAPNVQILTNNHDPYERSILTCRPVRIQKGAWIGAGSSILPGVSVGRYAIVGAASVVIKDVPDYAIVVGNPAHVVKMLDGERFEQQ